MGTLSQRQTTTCNPGAVLTNRQIRNANRLIEAGEPTAQVARDFGMSRATF
ncbi:ribosomal protein S14 [Cryobacterium sp. MP_3.1]|nr:ribosomal protein S14 [Cryobacterium sp. MP_3.1]